MLVTRTAALPPKFEADLTCKTVLETHLDPEQKLFPKPPEKLFSEATKERMTIVIVADPVEGVLLLTRLLTLLETPAKLNTLELLFRVDSLVAMTDRLTCAPKLNFPLMLLEETQIVPTALVPPTRLRRLESVDNVAETTTLKLIAPVVGKFVPTVLLITKDTPL